MTGFLDTKPERLLFDMGFQPVEGQWRLSAIVVDIKAPTPAEAAKDVAKNKIKKNDKTPSPRAKTG